MYSQESAIGIAHALLGDQQDDRAQHQDKAEDVEDGGAHAAGGGQERAGLVRDTDGNRKQGFCAEIIYGNFNRPSQLIVAGGSLRPFQVNVAKGLISGEIRKLESFPLS